MDSVCLPEMPRRDFMAVVAGGLLVAAELVALKVEIIIVFSSATDPVTDGRVTSLARPGGNATGLSTGAEGE